MNYRSEYSHPMSGYMENNSIGTLPEIFTDKKNLMYVGLGAAILFFLFRKKGKSSSLAGNPFRK